MTTSGVITSQMTVSDFVTAAMQELGVLSAGEEPSAEEMQLGIRSFNWMLKSWASKGANLWRETDGSVVWPANTATVTLSPYCIDVEDVRFVQSPTFERPLLRWEKGQYSVLPNKATPGNPSIYVVTKTASAIKMTLWPVPTAISTVKYTYVRVTEDVTDGSETVDLPQEWTEAGYLELAANLAQTFGVTRVDPATAQIVASRAQGLFQNLMDQDRPASIFMGPVGSRYF